MPDDPQVNEGQEQGVAQPTPEAQPFRQRMTVGEMMDMPDPGDPTPAPQPEVPDGQGADNLPPPITPDWLHEPPPQMVPQGPQHGYHQGPPQPPQPVRTPPPTTPQQGMTDEQLDAFVRNPEGFVASVLQNAGQQIYGPMAQQTAEVQGMLGMMWQHTVDENMNRADEAISRAYEVFNKDPEFRTNKEIQGKLGATLQGMRYNAEMAARAGNFEPLRNLSRITPQAIAGALAYAKAVSGARVGASGPIPVGNATVEPTRAAVGEHEVTLSPEQEAVARRLGPGARERMIQAQRDLEKYDDLQISE